ncbi:MAG: GIY-YIG nuclease family protein [Candidatus Magasanikbacteria bacterium]|nr:GIY-YIG nuclease family protein [Candidatus Magasanikbacteria bacterium]
MYYVYALQSLKNKNWLYIGSSENLRARFDEHTSGKVISTAKYRPLRLVYYEAFLNKKDATLREYQLKHNSQQKEQLKLKLINSLQAE